VAIDQEGGPVQRLIPPFRQLPSASELARLGPEAVVEWSSKAADELRRTGIQINLAPVLDVIPQGQSHFMEARSLGSDPARVAHLGRLWIEGLQRNGVSATAKHFPGLGRAELDPHHFAPVIRWQDDDAMRRDLTPFHEAILGGVHCVMTSHALYPSMDASWPATLSPVVNDEWLRRRLGFQGILLSDDMDMEAVSRKYTLDQMVRQGMRATIDFFLLCQRPENIEPFYRALRNAIDMEPVFAALHQKSVERIGKLFARHRISLPNIAG
jgi:beta-N-acetylhexosaminidase